MTEKETVTAREDQPRLTPAEWNGITNRLVELSQAMQKAGEAQGEAPQPQTCQQCQRGVPHACNANPNATVVARVETGAHPSQDARTEIYEAFIELVDEYHGSDPLDPNCRVCQLREIAAGARSTPSLPAQDARDLLKKLLATDGHDKDCPFTGCRCEYGEDYKVARAEAAAYLRGSTPSPDPPTTTS